jgi:hypothetical protein
VVDLLEQRPLGKLQELVYLLCYTKCDHCAKVRPITQENSQSWFAVILLVLKQAIALLASYTKNSDASAQLLSVKRINILSLLVVL